MPVRKIPIGTRALTGQHARSGAKYESGLERDFFELMTQDPLFDSVDWQPLHINYLSSAGKPLKYTPDALVTFRRDPATGARRRPLLAEVKYRSEYRKHFHELKARFRVARAYAKKEGWIFKVVTEREIRSVRFANRHFLHGFTERVPEPKFVQEIVEQLRGGTQMDVKSLLAAITADLWRQAEKLPTLWWMVAHSRIEVDLSKPLSMQSTVRLSHGNHV